MFREIRTHERITEIDEEERRRKEQFKKIKPKTDITVEDAEAFWNSLIMSMENAQ